MAKLEKCPGYDQNMLKMLPKISVIYNTLFDCFLILRQLLGDMDIPNPQQRQRWVNNTKKSFRAEGHKGFWSFYQAREDGVHVVRWSGGIYTSELSA